jgi:hypothetical protein
MCDKYVIHFVALQSSVLSDSQQQQQQQQQQQ